MSFGPQGISGLERGCEHDNMHPVADGSWEGFKGGQERKTIHIGHFNIQQDNNGRPMGAWGKGSQVIQCVGGFDKGMYV